MNPSQQTSATHGGSERLGAQLSRRRRPAFLARVAWHRLVVLLAIGVTGLCPLGASAGENVGDIEVSVQPLPTVEGGSGRNYGVSHGYIEYRVLLKNHSTADEHIVDLTYPRDSRGGRVTYGIVATRTVAVAPKQEVAVSLYHPFSESARDALGVSVRGIPDEHIVALRSMQGFRYEGTKCPAVLASRSVPRDFHDRVHTKTDTGSPPPASRFTRRSASSTSEPEAEPFTLLRSEVPVNQWSANWLGYSCYDAILLTDQDVEAMPPEVQGAIRRYVESGGILLFHGRSVPAVFTQGGANDKAGWHCVGLGHVAATAHGKEPDWDATYQKLCATSLYVYQPTERAEHLEDVLNSKTVTPMLITETTVPVRGLFVVVLLFVVLIGPINVILLSLYKRRVWLWWNVPAMSLLTCLAVFGFALLSEGWTARGKTATLTFLDERCHRAATIGYLSYYCPFTPSAGLHFDVNTEVTPWTGRGDWRHYYGRYHGGEGSLCFVDWTNDQHLATGWVSARVPAYFQVRKNEDRRERLTIEKKVDGALVVVNALGADIRKLYLADAAGTVFEAANIPVGEQRVLTPVADKKRAFGDGQVELREVFVRSDWISIFRSWNEARAPASLLVPDSYVAFLNKSPFIESPLAGADSVDSAAIVYGICKGQEDGR